MKSLTRAVIVGLMVIGLGGAILSLSGCSEKKNGKGGDNMSKEKMDGKDKMSGDKMGDGKDKMSGDKMGDGKDKMSGGKMGDGKDKMSGDKMGDSKDKMSGDKK